MCKRLVFVFCFMLFLIVVETAIAQDSDPNLLGWWKLNDGSGDIAYDSSGRENNGTIYNLNSGMGPDGSVWYDDPERGMVISFNGHDTEGAWVDAGRIPPMTLDNDFTWAFWVKQHSDQSADRYDVIIGNRFGGTQEPLQFIKFTPSEFEYYHRGGGPGGTNDVGTMDIEDLPYEVWVHQVVVKDGPVLTYYRDGKAADTITVENTIDGNPFYMGGDAFVSTDYHERWHGWLSDVRIYDKALNLREVLACMEGVEPNPYIAFLPDPEDEAVEVARDVVLSWLPGDFSDKRNVYLGTSFDDVNEASVDDQRGVLLAQGIENLSFDPPGDLDYGQTYYWRIDEVSNTDSDSPWKGEIWSFAVRNYLVVDDFEDYNDYPPDEIFMTWIDGFGDPTNGSTAGYPNPDFNAGEHYVETNIIHSGSQSMPVFYDNAAAISEVTRTLNADWSGDGFVNLTLFYYGDPANDAEQMYVALNGSAIVNNDDVNAALVSEWTQWDIPLQAFIDQGVNLSNVGSMTIGFGNKTNPTAGGEGHVFFDDIRLYRP